MKLDNVDFDEAVELIAALIIILVFIALRAMDMIGGDPLLEGLFVVAVVTIFGTSALKRL